MKTKLFFLTLSLLTFLITSHAQKEVCKNIYVWDFTDENGKKNNHTILITQEVENALTETSCRVLQRRNYAKLSEQIENEDAIQSIEGMPSTINQELQSIKAETVLFGEVKMDFSSNIMLSVSFQNLLTKEILKSEFIFLAGEDAHNIQKRQKKIKDFIAHCAGPKVVSDEETSYWRNVEFTNTIEAYETYLKKYKNGKYEKQAKAILKDEKKWDRILKMNYVETKVERLFNYVDDKESRHHEEAMELLEDLLWSEKMYDKYQSHFPEGKYADQVREKHEDYLYGKVLKSPYEHGAEYLAAFPNGQYIEEVKVKYEEAYYRAALNGKYWDIDGYLATFPNGKFTSQLNAKYEAAVYAAVVDNPYKYASTYLSKYPSGKYLAKVDDLYWGKAKTEITSFSAKDYLKLFPKGRHAEEAKKKARIRD